MSTIDDTVKIAMLNAALALLNAGSGDASGDLNLRNSGLTSLAVLPLSVTSFAGAANVSGTIKAAANAITPSGTPTAGTIATGQLRNRANAALFTFTIGTSGAEMNVGVVVIPGGTTAVGLTAFEVSLNAT